MATGKALLAKLRADPKTRDAQALAGWIKKRKLAKLASTRGAESKSSAPSKARSPVSSKPSKSSAFDDDDLDFLGKGSSTSESRGEKSKAKQTEQERYEARLIGQREKAERSRVNTIIKDLGGLKTRDDLRNEYSQIPNNFKRKDGMSGDDLADHLSTYYPELGVENERDLIDFLAA